MFKKILLPTDGSRHSLEAARVAGRMAQIHGAEVHPLVAVEFRYLMGDDIGEDLSRAIAERIRSRAQRALEQSAAAARECGATVADGRVEEGPPVDVSLRLAREEGFDLIVIASQGVSEEMGYDRLMGSVTERILHDAPCPVLVIRAQALP